ncbi:MAG: hypothetical protein HZA90_05195 [Verrucomicrobia bacterium]|nr:hypothetical protein [Verrucomicrobiota bacterium]
MKHLKTLIAMACLAAFLGGLSSVQAGESCCDKAKAAGKECTHTCCVKAAKDGKKCEKCNPPKDKEKK